MLRISVNESANGKTMKLEGKIAGPWVEEVSRTWLALTSSLGARELHVDLREVAFIDDRGRALLREIYQKSHASFSADSPLTHYFVDEATRPNLSVEEKGE